MVQVRGTGGYVRRMRFGNSEIRPVGGAPGCLAMLVVSVLASVILTVLANGLLR